jgi:hypothetical protein
MDGIVGSLRLGWNALLFKEDAYEEMAASENPVVKGLILIVIVGVIIAIAGFIGSGLELASTPDLGQIKDTVFFYMKQMPWWEALAQEDPAAMAGFEEWYQRGWDIFPRMFGAADLGASAAGIISIPLGLAIRWLVYGLLAYLFARWLGGSGNLAATLGALALAVAPQVLNVLSIFPFLQVGTIVSIWGVLCAYYGLKTVHRLSWTRALWATLLPFILVVALLVLFGCFGSAILGVVLGGQS